MLPTKRMGAWMAGLIGVFAVCGCAGSEPTQDAADSTDQAATEHAPADAEATALTGHWIEINERIDIRANTARTRLGDVMFPVGTGYNRDDAVCDVVMSDVSGAARWISPARYDVRKVETFGTGLDVFLSEADGSESDFVVRCYAYTRRPLAREMQLAFQKKITIDPAVFGPAPPISQ